MKKDRINATPSTNCNLPNLSWENVKHKPAQMLQLHYTEYLLLFNASSFK